MAAVKWQAHRPTARMLAKRHCSNWAQARRSVHASHSRNSCFHLFTACKQLASNRSLRAPVADALLCKLQI